MRIIRLVCTVCLFHIFFTPMLLAQTQVAPKPKIEKQPAQQQTADNELALSLAGVFGNHMVLQQQTDAPVWGFAKPGETVSVSGSWSQSVANAQADKNGKWKTKLTTPAAGGPFQIIVKTDSQSVKLADVLIGEVWICSGQSNMQWKMRGFGLEQFADAVAKADQPQIRCCQVPQILALEPQADIHTNWSVCNPQSVLNFSAVAYFFANRLHQELGVPIGIVSTNWGGSTAEAWVNQDVIASEFPEFDQTRATYPDLKKSLGVVHSRAGKIPKGVNHRLPSVLYNQMIYPLMPFAIRGVIWYQGESNVKQPQQYRKLFPALIRSWRDEWGQGDFPFYFVQIAPFNYTREPLPAALLREAQMKTLSVPNTGMAVTMDIGQADNIHPKEKQPVGERLAMIALAKDYGQKDLVYSGPVYTEQKIESSKIRLQFQHLGGGLASRDGGALSHFTIAGKDGNFVPAKAEIDGDTVVVHSEQIKQPVAVRFAWGNADSPNFMNKEGLPASSFRTDDWQVKQ